MADNNKFPIRLLPRSDDDPRKTLEWQVQQATAVAWFQQGGTMKQKKLAASQLEEFKTLFVYALLAEKTSPLTLNRAYLAQVDSAYAFNHRGMPCMLCGLNDQVRRYTLVWQRYIFLQWCAVGHTIQEVLSHPITLALLVQVKLPNGLVSVPEALVIQCDHNYLRPLICEHRIAIGWPNQGIFMPSSTRNTWFQRALTCGKPACNYLFLPCMGLQECRTCFAQEPLGEQGKKPPVRPPNTVITRQMLWYNVCEKHLMQERGETWLDRRLMISNTYLTYLPMDIFKHILELAFETRFYLEASKTDTFAIGKKRTRHSYRIGIQAWTQFLLRIQHWLDYCRRFPV